MARSERFFEIIRGERRGPAAALMRGGLWLASNVYSAIVRLRNAWYDHVGFATRGVVAPVVSIGNLTTGGTGKTPMTAWAANALSARGRRVGILTRGYKGRAITFDPTNPQAAQAQWRIKSDEADLLRRLCPAARVVIDPDRVAGARRAIAAGCDVLVMDDGFQHRRLRRDLDVVLIDATAPFGHGFVLPRGLLREPASGLRRAQLVILTRCDQVDPAARDGLRAEAARLAPDAAVLCSRHAVTGMIDLAGRAVSGIDLRAMNAVVFAGIANFASFEATVHGLGVKVAAGRAYPDHHDYADAEIDELHQAAVNLEANALMTTEKDAVKLAGRWRDESLPVLVPRIEMAFDREDEAVISQWLERMIARSPAR